MCWGALESKSSNHLYKPKKVPKNANASFLLHFVRSFSAFPFEAIIVWQAHVYETSPRASKTLQFTEPRTSPPRRKRSFE
jgi:hypothetical protein